MDTDNPNHCFIQVITAEIRTFGMMFSLNYTQRLLLDNGAQLTVTTNLTEQFTFSLPITNKLFSVAVNVELEDALSL